jgi:hypothetical protein
MPREAGRSASMIASRSSSVQHLHEACRMRLSFSNSLNCPVFRNDIEVVHAIAVKSSSFSRRRTLGVENVAPQWTWFGYIVDKTVVGTKKAKTRFVSGGS